MRPPPRFSAFLHLLLLLVTFVQHVDAQKLVDCVTMFATAECRDDQRRGYLEGGAAGQSKETRFCAQDSSVCVDDGFGEFFTISCTGSAASVRWFSDNTCSTPLPSNSPNGTAATATSCTSVGGGSSPFFINAECDVEDNTDTTSAFLVSLVINVVIALAAFLAFLIFRPHVPKVYMTRVTAATAAASIPDSEDADDAAPAPLTRSYLGWIWTVITMKDEEFYQHNGLDALVYLFFLRYGAMLFSACFVFGFIVLLPINYNGSNGQTGLDRYSLSNTRERSPDLWAHFVSAHLFSLLAIYLAQKYYRKFITYRVRYLCEGHPHQLTVLVRDVPTSHQDTIPFLAKFNEMYGDVIRTNVVMKVGKLSKVLAKRDKTRNALEHVMVKNAKLKPGKKRPTTKAGAKLHCIGGKVVDKEEHLTSELATLNQQYQDQLAKTLADPKWHAGGFVTFRTLASAASAQQSVHSGVPSTWEVLPAPEADDVHWKNMNISYESRSIRSLLMTAATGALIIFWIIPVTFVASLTTLQSLSEKIPFLEGVVDLSPIVKGFLEGFLPTLALVIFMAILPMIVRAFCTFEGIPAHTWISEAVMVRLFYFQVINVFFVSIIAGSVFNEIQGIIDDPMSIITLLGKSIPKTGTFFITYIMLRSFSGYPLAMLRIGDLVVAWVKKRFLCSTPRDFRAVNNPGSFSYGEAIPSQSLTILICLTYGTVAPIILPFGIAYFALAYFTAKYQLTYVYKKTSEGGGNHWPRLFNQIMSAILISEITVVGVMAVKKGVYQAPLMVPLILFTIMFWNHCNKVYARVAQFLPREDSVRIHPDIVDAKAFVQPELKADKVIAPEPFVLVGGKAKERGRVVESSVNKLYLGGSESRVPAHDGEYETIPIEVVRGRAAQRGDDAGGGDGSGGSSDGDKDGFGARLIRSSEI